MKRGLALVVSIFVILVAIGSLLIFDIGRTEPVITLANFEECMAAGYPVMESYPRQCRTPFGQSFTEVIETPATTTPATPSPTPTQPVATSTADLIKNISVQTGTKIASPLSITGEARGTWYFEATFPIQLVDANGKMIVETYAEAQGEWMTEKFVPFTAKVIFDTPTTQTGTLIFMNANPSGEPERSLEVRVPIVFW
ncbi:MAG: Gmad2 immunoglobulin-like domain-containing protein [bacterium]|nr:Gmad2 immunoglobulin-like domain-containing protein [bacterium]